MAYLPPAVDRASQGLVGSHRGRGRAMTEPSPDFTFDEQAADRAVAFFPRFLRHVKGQWAGQPFVLQPWQEDKIVRPLFGWKRPDGTRRYRILYNEVAKKNGKSALGSGLALLLLMADHEPGAEVYSVAADRMQAGIVFDVAKAMVENSPELASRCRCYKRALVVESTNSAYHVLSSDVPTKHGLNAHGIIFDELHAQPNRDLWDALSDAGIARTQPLLIALTTAGYDRHSICWEQHEYALKVRDGIIYDPTFLPVIYSANPDDDWTASETWSAANPNIGVTIQPEELAQKCKKAQNTPAYENTFKRLRLNLWTEQATRWLAMEVWDACTGEIDAKALEGQHCFAGLDLAKTRDVSALVLYFPGEGDQPSDVLPFFWVPEEDIRTRSHRDRVPYDVWVSQGYIESTPGNVTDYAWIRDCVNKLAEKYSIIEVAYDRTFATQLITELTDDGFTMVPFGQGFLSMAAPTEALERLVLGQLIRHGGNPVLRWMASNVCVTQDPAGNLKPDRSKSSEKIDGIVALIMAIGRAMVQPAPEDVWPIVQVFR